MIVLMPSDPLFESVDTAYWYLGYYLNSHVHFPGRTDFVDHSAMVRHARDEVIDALVRAWRAQKVGVANHDEHSADDPLRSFIASMDIQTGHSIDLSDEEREIISQSFVVIEEDMSKDDDGEGGVQVPA